MLEMLFLTRSAHRSYQTSRGTRLVLPIALCVCPAGMMPKVGDYASRSSCSTSIAAHTRQISSCIRFGSKNSLQEGNLLQLQRKCSRVCNLRSRSASATQSQAMLLSFSRIVTKIDQSHIFALCIAFCVGAICGTCHS